MLQSFFAQLRFLAINEAADERGNQQLENTREVQLEQATSLFETALKLHSLGNFDVARLAYEKLISIDIFSDDINVLLANTNKAVRHLAFLVYKNLADIYSKQGFPHPATHFYNKAVLLDSKDISLCFRLGCAALESQQYLLARHAFDSVLRSNAHHQRALEKLYETLYILGDDEACTEVLTLLRHRCPLSSHNTELTFPSTPSSPLRHTLHTRREAHHRHLQDTMMASTTPPTVYEVSLPSDSWMDLLTTLESLYHSPNRTRALQHPLVFRVLPYKEDSIPITTDHEMTNHHTDPDRTAPSRVSPCPMIDDNDPAQDPPISVCDDNDASLAASQSETTPAASQEDADLGASSQPGAASKRARRRDWSASQSESTRSSRRVREKQELEASQRAAEEESLSLFDFLYDLLPDTLLSPIESLDTDAQLGGDAVEAFARRCLAERGALEAVPSSLGFASRQSSLLMLERQPSVLKARSESAPRLDNDASCARFLSALAGNERGSDTGFVSVLYRACLCLTNEVDHLVWPDALVLAACRCWTLLQSHLDWRDHHDASTLQCQLTLSEMLWDMYMRSQREESAEKEDELDELQPCMIEPPLSFIMDPLSVLFYLTDGKRRAEHDARYAWLMTKIHDIQGQTEVLPELYARCRDALERRISPSSDLLLIYCEYDRVLSLATVEAKCAQMHHRHCLVDAQHLYEQGEYNRVVTLLLPVLSIHSTQENSIDNHTLATRNAFTAAPFAKRCHIYHLLERSLDQCGMRHQQVHCLSLHLNEILQQAGKEPALPWLTRITQTLRTLCRLLDEHLMVDNDALAASLARLLLWENEEDDRRDRASRIALCDTVTRSLLASSWLCLLLTRSAAALRVTLPAEVSAFWVLPWHVFFHVLHYYESLVVPVGGWLSKMSAYLSLVHSELGRQRVCLLDQGAFLNVCLRVFAAASLIDAAALLQSDQCYYCLFAVRLNADTAMLEDHRSDDPRQSAVFDRSAAERVYALVRPALQEKRSVNQAMRIDLRDILDQILGQIVPPPVNDHPLLAQQHAQIIATLEQPLFSKDASMMDASHGCIDLPEMYGEVYRMEAEYLRHQPSLSKTFETGRWDRRMDALQRASILLQWICATHTSTTDWMHLGDIHLAMADAILYAGPVSVHTSWDALWQSLTMAVHSYEQYLSMTSTTATYDTQRTARESLVIAYYTMATRPLSPGYLTTVTPSPIDSQRALQRAEAIAATVESMPRSPDAWRLFYLLGRCREKLRYNPKAYLGCYVQALQCARMDRWSSLSCTTNHNASSLSTTTTSSLIPSTVTTLNGGAGNVHSQSGYGYGEDTEELRYRFLSALWKAPLDSEHQQSWMRAYTELLDNNGNTAVMGDLRAWTVAELQRMKQQHRFYHKAIYKLAVLAVDAETRRQELALLFYLKPNTTKFWNIWRHTSERPGRFYVYCHKYARQLVDTLAELRDMDTMMVVLKRVRKTPTELFHVDRIYERLYEHAYQILREAVEGGLFIATEALSGTLRLRTLEEWLQAIESADKVISARLRKSGETMTEESTVAENEGLPAIQSVDTSEEERGLWASVRRLRQIQEWRALRDDRRTNERWNQLLLCATLALVLSVVPQRTAAPLGDALSDTTAYEEPLLLKAARFLEDRKRAVPAETAAAGRGKVAVAALTVRQSSLEMMGGSQGGLLMVDDTDASTQPALEV